MDDAPGFIRRRGTDVDTRCPPGGFAVGVCFDSPPDWARRAMNLLLELTDRIGWQETGQKVALNRNGLRRSLVSALDWGNMT